MTSELQVNTPVKTYTAKQRRWIIEYQKTLNATEAAMTVYKCKNRDVAKSIGSENLAKLDFPTLMEAMGLTDEKLLQVGLEGMNKAVRLAFIQGKTQAVADFATRHKYWDTFLKLKGKLTETQKLELTGKDGEPLRIELVAGIGFLNKPKDENH